MGWGGGFDQNYSEEEGRKIRHGPFAVFKKKFAGDLEGFIKIVELEALSLHALMMTSNPSYILIKPETLNVINKIINLVSLKNEAVLEIGPGTGNLTKFIRTSLNSKK